MAHAGTKPMLPAVSWRAMTRPSRARLAAEMIEMLRMAEWILSISVISAAGLRRERNRRASGDVFDGAPK